MNLVVDLSFLLNPRKGMVKSEVSCESIPPMRFEVIDLIQNTETKSVKSSA